MLFHVLWRRTRSRRVRETKTKAVIHKTLIIKNNNYYTYTYINQILPSAHSMYALRKIEPSSGIFTMFCCDLWADFNLSS